MFIIAAAESSEKLSLPTPQPKSLCGLNTILQYQASSGKFPNNAEIRVRCNGTRVITAILQLRWHRNRKGKNEKNACFLIDSQEV